MKRTGILWRNANRGPLPVWVVISLLILVVLISLRLAPSVQWQGRDDGIFSYVGMVIKDGGLPYRDAWDNKPPGVYYIDALSFALFGTNRWATWDIEVASIFASALLMFWLLNRLMERRLVALGGTLVFTLLARHPDLVTDNNFTESYALLPQVGCFLLGCLFLRQPRDRWAYAIGLSASLIFLYKQTSVGVALTFVPALVLSRHPVTRMPRLWFWLVLATLGGLTGLGVVSFYLLINGVLPQAYDAAMISPMALHNWIGQGPVPLWRTVETTLNNSAAPYIFMPLIPYWLFGIAVGLRRTASRDRTDHRAATYTTMALWALLTVPVDLVLANITNRAYRHYYITAIPSLSLLITFGLAAIIRLWDRPILWRRVIVAGLCGYLLVIGSRSTIIASDRRLSSFGWDVFAPAREDKISQYVARNTSPGDTVLVWGASSEINFQSGRLSPTQYHYGYPLVVPGYTTKQQIQDLVSDLENKQPTLIVDCARSDGPRVPPLDPDERQAWLQAGGRRDTTDLTPVYKFVANYCSVVTNFGRTRIYRCEYGAANGKRRAGISEISDSHPVTYEYHK